MAISPEEKVKRPNGVGSIYFDKTGKRWIASIIDINEKRIVKTCKLKRDLHKLETWLVEQKNAKEQGVATRSLHPKMTVAEFLNGWCDDNQYQMKANTYRYYKQTIKNRIEPFIGKLNAAKLSTKSVNSLIKQMFTHGYSETTVKGACRTLSSAYNHAISENEMPLNPVIKAKVPQGESVSSKAIPREDFIKIYREAMKNPWMHARVEIGMMMGLRPGEVAGLKWTDIDNYKMELTIERQIQRVKGKGLAIEKVKQKSGSRPIPISTQQLEILETLKKFQDTVGISSRNDENWIFPNSDGGRLSPEVDRKRWKALMVSAWVPSYERYQMRKTAFTNLAETLDTRTLMSYSGHTQVKTLLNSYVSPNNATLQRGLRHQDQIRAEVLNKKPPKLRAV